MSAVSIPFLDLAAQHVPLRAELDAAMAAVIDASAFAGGVFVERFEAEFAAFCGARHAVGVGSGTEALWLSLLALGVGPGDEVVTVANSFIATAEAISFTGATPVFVEIDPVSRLMDPDALSRALSAQTKAIIPVHLHGHPADLGAILRLADARGIAVVEDACQAHGAMHRGRGVGTWGRAGCFSFYPGKNLGAMGEAGAIITDDSALAAELRMLRDHGQRARYHHVRLGWNARMDGLQAAVLRVKLRYLDGWNSARRSRAAAYAELLRDVPGLCLPTTASGDVSAWHLFCIAVDDRDSVLRDLAGAGIVCGIHYPVPIHLQEPYRGLGMERGSLPHTERLAGQLLSLPLYPELTHEKMLRVAGVLRQRLEAGRIPEVGA